MSLMKMAADVNESCEPRRKSAKGSTVVKREDVRGPKDNMILLVKLGS